MSLPGLFSGSIDFQSDVDPILDAALEVFADIGLRRATVDDIAKRAGVGRVTVYRKIGRKDDVLNAVLVRESIRLFEKVRGAAEAADTYQDRVVNAFATTVSVIRENPVWNRILELESGTILDRLTVNGTLLLGGAVEATADVLRFPGIEVEDEELLARAEILVRITHSILLTPQVRIPLETFADVEAFAHTYLLAIALPESSRSL